MGLVLKDFVTGAKAIVNSFGRLYTSLETDAATNPAQVSAVKIFSENDNGARTGNVLLKAPETSEDYRLRVGIDNLAFQDTFNAITQNTNVWYYTFATLTAAQPGAGTINFSTVQGTTSSHGAMIRSYQQFPLIATAPYALEFVYGQFINELISGEVFLMGIGFPTSALMGGVPLDGVWVKITTDGVEGIISYSGTQYSTGIIQPHVNETLNTMEKLTIVIGERNIVYWLDDELLAEQLIPASNGIPFLGVSSPIFMMKYNTGPVTNTNQIRVSRVSVMLNDIAQNKSWFNTLSMMGASGYVGQNGHTMGSTSGNFGATAAIPATQVGSNTAPNVAMAGLGGMFQMTAQASAVGASGDMVAQYYLNPAHTVNIPGRNLYVKGIKISCINYGAVVAVTPTTLVWGLAYGHTAVSLATPETASFANATTHAPRRIPLGQMYIPVGGVIGQPYDKDIYINFENGIAVRPGEYLASTVRFLLGTATASQTILYTITYDCVFE